MMFLPSFNFSFSKEEAVAVALEVMEPGGCGDLTKISIATEAQEYREQRPFFFFVYLSLQEVFPKRNREEVQLRRDSVS